MSDMTKIVRPSDVHRSASTETFLSHVTMSSAGLKGTVKPRKDHSYYRFDDPLSAVPLLYGLEVLRQAETYLAHSMDRPSDDHFIWRSIALHVDKIDPLMEIADHTFQLDYAGCVSGSRHQYRGRARVGNTVVVLDDFAVTFVSADMYERLPRIDPCKSDSAPVFPTDYIINPNSIGRTSRSDIAISGGENETFRVAAPYDSPVFFEHTQDHWPGMVLIDAATQLAALKIQGAGLKLKSLRADFQHYSELSAPVDMAIHAIDNDALHEVIFSQAERVTTIVELGVG